MYIYLSFFCLTVLLSIALAVGHVLRVRLAQEAVRAHLRRGFGAKAVLKLLQGQQLLVVLGWVALLLRVVVVRAVLQARIVPPHHERVLVVHLPSSGLCLVLFRSHHRLP